MRSLLFWIAAMAGAPAAAAQAPRVPVPIPADDFGGCSTAYVFGLSDRGSERYLSVRSKPSARARELGRLRNGAAIFACVRDGDWFGIVYADAAGVDCGVLGPQPAVRDYAGPCRSGWAHERWIGGYADWISP